MNYQRIYDDLMLSRLSMKEERYKSKKNGSYFEGHHIIPKCKGGTGNSNRGKTNPNIVLLTAREHFLAHWLLWRIYRDRQTALAFHKMLSNTSKTQRIKSSRGFEEAREAFRLTNIGNKHGVGKTKIVSESQKKKQSEIMKGRYVGELNPFFGKKHSDQTKEKLRKSREGFVNEKIPTYKGKKVVLKDGEVKGIFESSLEVAKFIGTSHSNVRHVLSGKQKTANGFEIKYLSQTTQT